jgi:hypothetical protein
MPAGHGIGQLAQLDGKLVKILAQRRGIHAMTPTPRVGNVKPEMQST